MTRAPLVRAWSPGSVAACLLVVLTSVLIHVLLLPTPGYVGDIDQFVLWVHDIATMPFGHAYDVNLSFPPVMVFLWGLLGAIEPAFRTVTTSADSMIRTVMKAPASLADLGLAAGVAFYLRDRPRWAVAAMAAVALNPVVLYVSAWWGQYESIYTLGGVVAFLFAARGHRDAASIALGLALMTKPQAVPFLIPFAAWVLGIAGWRGAARAATIMASTIAAVWLPFLAAGGPIAYMHNLTAYQRGIFAVLSLHAWNPWWIIQQAGGGQFASDTTPIIGPITLRLLGYMAAGLGEAMVFVSVLRHPTSRSLALGLAASVLIAFVALTGMHERYSYAAVVFLAALVTEPRLRLLFGCLSVVSFANVLAASVIEGPLAFLSSAVWISIAGSILMTGIAVASLIELNRHAIDPSVAWADEMRSGRASQATTR